MEKYLRLENRVSILKRYLIGIITGRCFEYVHRVESERWYIPLIIGIFLVLMMIIDIIGDSE